MSTYGSAFRNPDMPCAAAAAAREEVRVLQLVITPGRQDADQAAASMGAMRAAHSRALAARKALQEGLDFEQLQEMFSNPYTSARSTPSGFFRRGQAWPIVERAAFCLGIDEVSPVFLADDGFHVLQVVEAR